MKPLIPPVTPSEDMDQLCINTIRTLSIDAVQKAGNGHPGAPLGLAPAAYVLWQDYLRAAPSDPQWPDRDRFVLSNGHASMLLYSLLFLSNTGELSLDDLKALRQMGSRCPGHPERGLTPGVEITTGPLGQGVANSVGMSIASRWQAARYNRDGYAMFGWRVWAFCSDGDLMEGISSEAASVAGHLKLGNLCWVYDNNHITIDGSTALSFTEDVAARFRAYGWAVEHVTDANDLQAISAAYRSAVTTADRPTLIVLDTHIGYGSPLQDTPKVHGEAMGEENVRATKKFLGWPEDAHFLVPDGVREHFATRLGIRGDRALTDWHRLLDRYRQAFPAAAEEMVEMLNGELPVGWDRDLPQFAADPKGLATRESSATVLQAIALRMPWLVGGAADLGASTKVKIAGEAISPDNVAGRNVHFGIREHSMAAICNGLAVSKLRPFASSFFVFTDYARPSMRLSAIMKLPVIYIFTHDSINLGEDGTTHQPIEQLASFRAMPGMTVLRPADANEVTEAWRVLMQEREGPTLLVLTRQKVPTFDRTIYGNAAGLAQGAYVLADSRSPAVILIGTGSEVALCLEAYERLKAEGISARVVSMPSWELFDRQSRAYRETVLPPQIPARVAVEAASCMGWERYVGTGGAIIGMTRFGESAPREDLVQAFGFTADHVVETARRQLGRHTGRRPAAPRIQEQPAH